MAKTCGITPSPEGFAYIHKVHHQLKVVTAARPDRSEDKAEAQYGCYNFTYRDVAGPPLTAYKNKWPDDWASWFYHNMNLDTDTKSHPLVTNRIRELGETPRIEVTNADEHSAFVAMLRSVSKVFSTRDLMEEYVACCCFPLKVSWTVSQWLPKERWVGDIPVPNFATSFKLKKTSMRSAASLPMLFTSLSYSWSLQTSIQSPWRPGPMTSSDWSPYPSTRMCSRTLTA